MNHAAELSSLATSLEELTQRVTAVAAGFASGASGSAVAGELFEVERVLLQASRRLAAVAAQSAK